MPGARCRVRVNARSAPHETGVSWPRPPRVVTLAAGPPGVAPDVTFPVGKHGAKRARGCRLPNRDRVASGWGVVEHDESRWHRSTQGGGLSGSQSSSTRPSTDDRAPPVARAAQQAELRQQPTEPQPRAVTRGARPAPTRRRPPHLGAVTPTAPPLAPAHAERHPPAPTLGSPLPSPAPAVAGAHQCGPRPRAARRRTPRPPVPLPRGPRVALNRLADRRTNDSLVSSHAPTPMSSRRFPVDAPPVPIGSTGPVSGHIA